MHKCLSSGATLQILHKQYAARARLGPIGSPAVWGTLSSFNVTPPARRSKLFNVYFLTWGYNELQRTPKGGAGYNAGYNV